MLRHSLSLATLPLAISLAFPTAVRAADEDAIVVTATRAPGARQNAAADTSVIYRDRITQGASLAETLAQDAGVEFTTNGGPTSTTGIYIRGTKPAQSAVYIDGFRLINPTDGVSPIEQIPTASLDRIEVVRGAASGLYGSGAIGGVVQLFTRAPEHAPAADAALGASRYRSYEAEAGYGGQVERTGFHLGVSADGSRGFSVANAGAPSFVFEPDRDGYRRKSVSAGLQQDLGTGQQLRLNALAVQSRSDVDVGQTSGPAPFKEATTTLVGATYSTPVSGPWSTEVKAGRTAYNYEFKNAGFVFAPRTSSLQLGWLNHFRLTSGTLTAGLEREEQRVSGDGTSYGRNGRDINSGFLQWIGQYGPHGIQAKLRSDRWTDYNYQNTGGLLYSYALTPAWSLTGSAGRAFRAPTFDDLYFPFGSNPNLRPERSRSTELGGRYRQGNDEARLVLFRNRIRDSIELDAFFIPQNVQAEITGTTLSWRHSAPGWDWQVALTHQNPEDVDTGAQLARRAKNIASARLERESGAWRFGSELRGQGDRFDTGDNAAGGHLGGYGLVNLYANYAASERVVLQARLDNATDKRYELAQHFNTPGRSVFLGVRYTPK